jgi:hypothetical protein
MIKNRLGILVPDTPVMRAIVPRLPNETPISSDITYRVLADNDGVAIQDNDDALIEVNNNKHLTT